MKEFLISLCLLLITGSVIRTLVDEERFSKYYSVISSVVILVMIASGVPELVGELELSFSEIKVQENTFYEEQVLLEACERLEEELTLGINNELGFTCDVSISLSYKDDSVLVDGIFVQCELGRDRVREFIKSCLGVEESVIHFN